MTLKHFNIYGKAMLNLSALLTFKTGINIVTVPEVNDVHKPMNPC